MLVGIFLIKRPWAAGAEGNHPHGKLVESDRNFGRLLEENLPPHSMVFQMPVMCFPAAGPVLEVQGHDMLRPFLVTRTLRFSFGAMYGTQP